MTANAAVIGEFSFRGKDTALAGMTFEYILDDALNEYVRLRRSGFNEDGSRELVNRFNKFYNPTRFRHNKTVMKAHQRFGHDEWVGIGKDAVKTADSLILHLTEQQEMQLLKSHHTGGGAGKGRGEDAVKKLTGKTSSADLVLKGKKRRAKPFKFLGASLKYSKSLGENGNRIKIYAPTVETFAELLAGISEKITGKSCRLLARCRKIADNSIDKQETILARHHKVLSRHFGQNVVKSFYGKLPIKYTPIKDERGVVVRGRLSHGATSYMRDLGNTKPSLHNVYADLILINLQTKRQIAQQLARVVKNIMKYGSKQDIHMLFQRILNLGPDQLDTLNVTVSRQKDRIDISIFDLKEAIKIYLRRNQPKVQYRQGTINAQLGPVLMTPDMRPGFSRDPLKRGVNVTIFKNRLLK